MKLTIHHGYLLFNFKINDYYFLDQHGIMVRGEWEPSDETIVL